MAPYAGVPRVFGLDASAVVAHLSRDDVLDDERLLQDGPRDDFCLNGELHLDSLRVGFSPDELGVDQPHLGERLELLQAERHQLAGLEAAAHPLVRRVQVPAMQIEHEQIGDE